MKSVRGALILCAVSTSTLAQSAGIDPFGVKIGMIVGAESLCGLTFDHDAIETFIRDDARAQSAEFKATYNHVSRTYEKSVEDGIRTAMEAHGPKAAEKAKASMCETVRQGAEDHGFID